MEDQQQIQKSKTKKVVLFSLGTLALGTLTFFGIKLFKNHKTKTTDDNSNENNDVDTETTNQNPTKPVVHSSLPSAHANSSFPLRFGSKGDRVLRLQRALITTYGAGVFEKYGADGYFGKELESVLRNKGYQLPLSESDFNKITQEKKLSTSSTTIQTQTPPQSITSFNSSAIAKAIYDSLIAKDFPTSITLLKGIKNTTEYNLVSEQLKSYRINGVRQTLVNAFLNTYSSDAQKLSIRVVFIKMGLKYTNGKWVI